MYTTLSMGMQKYMVATVLAYTALYTISVDQINSIHSENCFISHWLCITVIDAAKAYITIIINCDLGRKCVS